MSNAGRKNHRRRVRLTVQHNGSASRRWCSAAGSLSHRLLALRLARCRTAMALFLVASLTVALLPVTIGGRRTRATGAGGESVDARCWTWRGCLLLLLFYKRVTWKERKNSCGKKKKKTSRNSALMIDSQRQRQIVTKKCCPDLENR